MRKNSQEELIKLENCRKKNTQEKIYTENTKIWQVIYNRKLLLAS